MPNPRLTTKTVAAPDAKIRMRPDGLLELFCVILSAAKDLARQRVSQLKE